MKPVWLICLSLLVFHSGYTESADNTGDALLPATGKTIVDLHVHVAGLGYGDSGCFISETMRENFRFPFFLWAMGVTEEDLVANGDRVLLEQLSNRVSASKTVSHAVILALDGYVADNGELDVEKTQIYVPGNFIALETAQHDNLLYGASINPNREDAVERLRDAHASGAVLVKWIPSIMNIDPANAKFETFYKAMAELQIPLLTHTGMEKSFAGAVDELADPRRLQLPLELGVTVIAAHIATTGESEGQDNFERILPMFAKYPNLYADISSLTQINKLGYLARALSVDGVTERMLYGSDWPLQVFPLISPWYHVNHIGARKAWNLGKIENLWDRDVALKAAFGVPDTVFERVGELLKIEMPDSD